MNVAALNSYSHTLRITFSCDAAKLGSSARGHARAGGTDNAAAADGLFQAAEPK